MRNVFINIFIMQKHKMRKIVMHYLYLSKHTYLSKLFTVKCNLSSLSLKNY